MFEAIVQPKLHDREDLFQPVSGTPVTSNILDIRSDTGKSQLQDSLRQGIEAACRGEAAMPDLLLWDDKGLRYFEDVTYSPNYYLTLEEIGILEFQRHSIANHIPAGSMLVELGSGNLRKVKILLDTLDELGRDVDYFALDVSFADLQRSLSLVPPGTYEHVRCFGLCGTYDDGREWLQHPMIQERPKMILSLGSTLGSFERQEAAKFLSSFIPRASCVDDSQPSNLSFLLGLDGCKDEERVHAAYNDEKGLNRRFIKQGLEKANAVVGHEAFDLNTWEVFGRWDRENGCHNQFYSPRTDVSVVGSAVPAGKRLLAIQSHKYDAEDREVLCQKADLEVVEAWSSSNGYTLLALRSIH